MIQLKTCPFCGGKPTITTDGTYIEIWCCSSMSRQKSDYLTFDERDTWNDNTDRFSPEAESKVLEIVSKEWNTRK